MTVETNLERIDFLAEKWYRKPSVLKEHSSQISPAFLVGTTFFLNVHKAARIEKR